MGILNECYFLNKKQLPSGKYELTYQYGATGEVESVELDSLHEVRKWMDSLKAGAASRAMNGPKLSPDGWINYDLEKLGYTPVWVKIVCNRSQAIQARTHKLPPGCGTAVLSTNGSDGKGRRLRTIREAGTNRFEAYVTRRFNDPKTSAASLKKLCAAMKMLFPDELQWNRKVVKIALRNSDRVTSVWSRKAAKSENGMDKELICESIDGLDYRDATLWEIIEATEGLGDYTCYKQSVNKSKSEMVCIMQTDVAE